MVKPSCKGGSTARSFFLCYHTMQNKTLLDRRSGNDEAACLCHSEEYGNQVCLGCGEWNDEYACLCHSERQRRISVRVARDPSLTLRMTSANLFSH